MHCRLPDVVKGVRKCVQRPRYDVKRDGARHHGPRERPPRHDEDGCLYKSCPGPVVGCVLIRCLILDEERA